VCVGVILSLIFSRLAMEQDKVVFRNFAHVTINV